MNPILDNILVLEGGYVNNPKDKGGATNWGITEATARKHGYLNDMRNLTRREAYAILEEDYWIKPGFKDVANLSESIAFELCDAAVNIGQHHPVLWLQRWLNAFNQEERSYQDIDVDGKIGPQTIATLQHYLAVRGKEGEEVLVKALNCSQGAWYLNLAEKNQQNEEFIYGWMKNRVS
ncbi:glycoside hydrolase family 108 protein [Citrobacter cronae]|uniref:glycoside hydrolase family 108 protein n=1 Tax=Citrobacter cronae TaxID=1748967 RepID=UPI0021D129AF|nr:glycoside hydrolase family 108 protein [Citrobacter cronae]MCU6173802.1 glycoside hydrolase family 108 protein [Citrobacter cronae]